MNDSDQWALVRADEKYEVWSNGKSQFWVIPEVANAIRVAALASPVLEHPPFARSLNNANGGNEPAPLLAQDEQWREWAKLARQATEISLQWMNRALEAEARIKATEAVPEPVVDQQGAQ